MIFFFYAKKLYKDYARTYNVKILNSFNLELQLINPEFAIKNKLKELLN